MSYRKISSLLLLLGVLLASRSLYADDAAAGKDAAKSAAFGKFLRVLRADDGQPIAMQTSISRYIPTDPKRDGVIVELVSAVHVGEGEYYSTLNKLFKEFDVVLYELVAPEGTRIP